MQLSRKPKRCFPWRYGAPIPRTVLSREGCRLGRWRGNLPGKARKITTATTDNLPLLDISRWSSVGGHDENGVPLARRVEYTSFERRAIRSWRNTRDTQIESISSPPSFLTFHFLRSKFFRSRGESEPSSQSSSPPPRYAVLVSLTPGVSLVTR